MISYCFYSAEICFQHIWHKYPNKRAMINKHIKMKLLILKGRQYDYGCEYLTSASVQQFWFNYVNELKMTMGLSSRQDLLPDRQIPG